MISKLSLSVDFFLQGSLFYWMARGEFIIGGNVCIIFMCPTLYITILI